MITLRSFGAIAVACLLAGEALAADPPASPPFAELPPVPELPPQKQETSGNWYLRGDIGYVVTKPALEAPAGVWYLQNYDLQNNPIWALSNSWLGPATTRNGWEGGVGIGYDFGLVRADVTADYMAGAKIKAPRYGSNIIPDRSYNCESDSYCVGEDNGKFTRVTLMANIYADLATWEGVTPYVGFGLGAALRQWDLSATQTCFENGYGCLPSFPPTGGTRSWNQGKGSEWVPAWALMAGLSYNISDNLALDVNYQYLNIEGHSTRPYTSLRGDKTGTFTITDSQSQAIRFGARYTFGTVQ